MSDNPSVFCCPAHSSLSPSLSLSPPKLPPPPYSIRAAVRGGLSLCLGVESDLLASCTSIFSFEDTWRDLSVTKNEGVAVSYLIPPSRYSTSSLSYGSKSCAVAFPCAFVCLPPNKYNWQENVISGWGCTGPVQIMSIISIKNLQRWAKWNASAHLLVQDIMSPLQCLQIKKYEVSQPWCCRGHFGSLTGLYGAISPAVRQCNDPRQFHSPVLPLWLRCPAGPRLICSSARDMGMAHTVTD